MLKKGIFNLKREYHHRFLRIQVSLDNKLHFKQTILKSCTKSTQKGYFRSKTKKVNITVEFFVFELIQVPIFTLNKQLWIFRPILAGKGIFGLEEEKVNVIIKFWISVVTKYRHKHTILIFWTKFAQKDYF